MKIVGHMLRLLNFNKIEITNMVTGLFIFLSDGMCNELSHNNFIY